MRFEGFLLILTSALLFSGCGSNKTSTPTNIVYDNSNTSTNGSTNEGNNSSINTGNNTNGGSSSSSGSSSQTNNDTQTPKKTIVKAHTLKDTNFPSGVFSQGQVVTEDTWESFRNASSSKFNNNYNFTYTAFSGGYLISEKFTKNGYYLSSSAGTLYYERKSGSTFYNYVSTSEGYLRQETTLDIQSKYTSRIQNEIYTHMFDFENYEYDSYDGTYRYYGSGFTAAARFQGGYLTYLYYILGMNLFEIKASFETTIDIPESYYYA